MFYENQTRSERGNWHGCGAANWKNAVQMGRFGRFGRHFAGNQTQQVAVNIREKADFYELFVFAPGLTKDAFNLAVADDVLTISALPGHDDSKWLHHEYRRGGFERQFLLHQKIETDGITARYNDGVLEVMLPKLPGTSAQEIPVA